MAQSYYLEKIKDLTQLQKNKTQAVKFIKTKLTTMKNQMMTKEIQMTRQKEMIYLKISNMIILPGLKWISMKSLALMIKANLKSSVIMQGYKLINRQLQTEARIISITGECQERLMIIRLMMKKFSISLEQRGSNKCKKILLRILMMSLVMTFKDLLILIMRKNQWLSGLRKQRL